MVSLMKHDRPSVAWFALFPEGISFRKEGSINIAKRLLMIEIPERISFFPTNSRVIFQGYFPPLRGSQQKIHKTS